jgi:uncharacterized membrane protein
MIYACLKALHLLAVVVWIGGMFFMLVCLRPAAQAVLEPPDRIRLLHATIGRFFAVVAVSALVVFLSGAAMIGLAAREAAAAGLAFNLPLEGYAMVALFVAMLAVFAHARLAALPRLGRALAAGAWADGAAALKAIRRDLGLNLALGVLVVVVVRLGAAA